MPDPHGSTTPIRFDTALAVCPEPFVTVSTPGSVEHASPAPSSYVGPVAPGQVDAVLADAVAALPLMRHRVAAVAQVPACTVNVSPTLAMPVTRGSPVLLGTCEALTCPETSEAVSTWR